MLWETCVLSVFQGTRVLGSEVSDKHGVQVMWWERVVSLHVVW